MTRLAVVRHEWLRDCEAKAGSDARTAIAAAAAKNDRASVCAFCGYAEQARVEYGGIPKGFELKGGGGAKDGGGGAAAAAGGTNGSSTGGAVAPPPPPPSSHQQQSEEEALSALEESCRKFTSAVARLGKSSKAKENDTPHTGLDWSEVRERFDRCAMAGCGVKGGEIFGRCVRGGVAKRMDNIVRDLERQQATKRRLGAQAEDGGGGGMHVHEDEANPEPHLTALTFVLGEASVALAQLHGAAGILDGKGDLLKMMEHTAHDASVRAKKVLDRFLTDSGLPDLQARALEWMEATLRDGGQAMGMGGVGSGGRGAGGRRGGDEEEEVSAALDVEVLDTLLEEVADVIAICNRFLTYVKDGLALESMDLPLFVDTLQLVGKYVDLGE